MLFTLKTRSKLFIPGNKLQSIFLAPLLFILQVLRKLRYVDANNAVQLKGRVACEISNHELMITELVFENAFTNLHPTEIVALLSCFVFQQVNVAFSLGPFFTDYI